MSFTYSQAVADLDRRGFGIKADLSRISALMDVLDNPQLNYPTIHIAGTNGKTTTARMIAALLAAHGIKAGTYTSPHLQSVRERIQLWGLGDDGVTSNIISKRDFAGTYGYLQPFINEIEQKTDSGFSYFEETTAIAFEWMSESTVAAGVIEAGLGGTWDATNVVEGKVAVICPIDVDHQRFLGSTPVDNAVEKAGIIKQDSVVICAEQGDDVSEVMKRRCSEVKGDFKQMGAEFDVLSNRSAVGGRLATIKGLHATYEDLHLSLFGAHQVRNLALAIAAVESFVDSSLNADALEAGLGAVTSPGRLELVRNHPLVILDGAHNPHAAEALRSSLGATFGERRTTLVVSIVEDKDIDAILGQLETLADRIIFTKSTNQRAADPMDLARRVKRSGVEVSVAPRFEDALEDAMSSAEEQELILVTGSLYLVGDARTYLLGPVD